MKLIFGGMYGRNSSGNHNNPFTGNQTCPKGYTSAQISGTPGMDFESFFCYREGNSTESPLPVTFFSFGGLYGNKQILGHKNPITKNSSCPTDYKEANALGDPTLDHDLKYCYRELESNHPNPSNSFDFGGMFGTGGVYTNPATGANNCPIGFAATQIYGELPRDFAIFVCTRTVVN